MDKNPQNLLTVKLKGKQTKMRMGKTGRERFHTKERM
jgi:hypothetical protein